MIFVWVLPLFCLYKVSIIYTYKKYGVTVEILKRGYSKTLKLCQMRGGLTKNVSKIRVQWFIPLTKINIINFNYDLNILH